MTSKKGKVVHLSDETHAKMKRLAEDRGIPASKLVEQLIKDAIARTAPFSQPPFWELNKGTNNGRSTQHQTESWS